MAKTTPVRWWRDDADRYASRGPYVAPQTTPDADAMRWAIELIAGPPDPDLQRVLDTMREASSPEAIARSLGIPLDMWSGPAEDPIETIVGEMQRLRRLAAPHH